jgi:YqxM protein
MKQMWQKAIFLLVATLLVSLVVAPVAFATVSVTWDKSSLEWCCVDASSTQLHAKVCNTGDDMTGTTTWELYWKDSSQGGDAKDGELVTSGTIPALKSGECYDIYYTFAGKYEAGDKYAVKAYQRPGHPGTGVLWITAPDENGPCPPVPEIATIGLLSIGLLTVGGAVWVVNRKRAEAA